jgi:hypothetical protein
MRSSITARWNPKRGETTYKVQVNGSSHFLLFNAEELSALRGQIDTALGGTDHDKRNKQ